MWEFEELNDQASIDMLAGTCHLFPLHMHVRPAHAPYSALLMHAHCASLKCSLGDEQVSVDRLACSVFFCCAPRSGMLCGQDKGKLAISARTDAECGSQTVCCHQRELCCLT